MEQHEALREIMRNLERKMGVLEFKLQVDGLNITFAQCHALVEIGRAKTLSLIRLSEILELEAPTVSRTVDRLVNAQLVNRNTDPSNRRYITISLTEDGEKVFHEIENTMNLRFKRILQNIPENKQDEVIDNIKVLTTAIQSLE